MSIENENAFRRYVATLPKVFDPEFNRVIRALLLGIAASDDEICTQIQNAKSQLFVRTATGQDLDELANSLGVSRPPTLGLQDGDFQELIPNLSLRPKQIKQAFYNTADVFWGPLFSRANITTQNAGPFDLQIGDEIIVIVDGGEPQSAKVLVTDIATPGAATAAEVAALLNNKIDGVTAEVLTDSLTGDETISLRTNTPGSAGTIEVATSSGVGALKVDFPLGEADILDLDQRVSIYNINPNELLIELPSIVPALRRTLRGSHHFHADGTLEPPRGTEQGVWAGSFLFDPNGTQGSFTISGQRAVLTSNINQGDVLTSINVDDNSNFEVESGQLIFGFGTNAQEVPVGFRGVPNSNTILIDPSHTFVNDHPAGTVVNVLRASTAYVPQNTGQDLAVYLTSPSGAREIVEDILRTLAAAGIIINFAVLAPDYIYLLDNPYLSDDDAPSCE